jgi:hypothetical protein
MKGNEMEQESEHALVRVKNFPNRVTAEAAQSCLQANDIEAILQGSDFAGTGMLQGFDLYVQAKDRDAAHDLLETLYDGI